VWQRRRGNPVIGAQTGPPGLSPGPTRLLGIATPGSRTRPADAANDTAAGVCRAPHFRFDLTATRQSVFLAGLGPRRVTSGRRHSAALHWQATLPSIQRPHLTGPRRLAFCRRRRVPRTATVSLCITGPRLPTGHADRRRRSRSTAPARGAPGVSSGSGCTDFSTSELGRLIMTRTRAHTTGALGKINCAGLRDRRATTRATTTRRHCGGGFPRHGGISVPLPRHLNVSDRRHPHR